MKRNPFVIVMLIIAMLLSTQSFSVAEDVPTIVILSTDSEAYANITAFDIIEEKCGVNLEFMFVPRDVAPEKFSIMAQTNSLPDLIYRMNRYINTPSEIYRLGLDGVILPLEDLIDQYAPNLKARLESNPDYVRASTAPNGSIYAVIMDNGEASQDFLNRTFIETSFLENLGMEMPTNPDELYEYLVAVKENDANGNGDPDDEIPMVSCETGNDGSMFRSIIMTYFTKAGVNDNRIVNDGRVEFLGATEGYKQGLEFLSKLYAEDLIYKDVFSINDASEIRQINERDENVNTIGLVVGQHQRIAVNTDGVRHYTYDYCPAFEGGYVAQIVKSPVQLSSCISATCSDPAAAMRVLDFIVSDEGSIMTRMGIEGKDWVIAEEGALTPSGDPAYWRYTTQEEKDAMNEDGSWVFGSLGNGWPMFVPDFYWEEAVGEGMNPKDNWGWYHNQHVLEAYAKALLPDENFMPSIIYYGPEMIDEISLLEVNLTNALKRASAEFVIGTRNIETDWDAYLEELNSLGLDRYLELSQQVYDAYYGI